MHYYISTPYTILLYYLSRYSQLHSTNSFVLLLKQTVHHTRTTKSKQETQKNEAITARTVVEEQMKVYRSFECQLKLSQETNAEMHTFTKITGMCVWVLGCPLYIVRAVTSILHSTACYDISLDDFV